MNCLASSGQLRLEGRIADEIGTKDTVVILMNWTYTAIERIIHKFDTERRF